MFLLVLLALSAGVATSGRLNTVNKFRTAVELATSTDSGCACTKQPAPQCGCCTDFEYEGQHKVCVNTTYISSEKALRFTVTFDGKVVVNETLSAKNPPAFCQGIKPLAYICEKYSNMSYGDDHKWGGCLEITGGVIFQILDVKFGCFYLPVEELEVNSKMTKEHTNPSLVKRFQDRFMETVMEKAKEWSRGWKQRQENKKSSLMHILFKNRVDDEVIY